ncbi:hypothetical protein [Kribbella sp. NBC_00889]|uniref:hypothetical protein n=1 Tax=Kribbella sp. NBC_00889 TaxID=2975974 RepID=UPI00386DAD83|nr:hypothetical protein OG817_22080 [Kribbella sp. NBC_00889]
MTTNAVELSPLTIRACVRRITSDLHPGRSEAAMCSAVSYLGDAAGGLLDQHLVERVLRGLAAQAKPEEYNELVRQTLAVVALCGVCGVPADDEMCDRCASVTNP